MKNKIVDLNNHLFAQLERLGDENLTPDGLDKEVKRAEAMVKVSEQIVRSAGVSLRAAEIASGSSLGSLAIDRLPLLESGAKGANGGKPQ